jgi:hypothetical protein
MTDINQNFSDPELESIINNASEKIVTASADDEYLLGWFIFELIFYTTAAGIQLFQFTQTSWNKLHLALSAPPILIDIVCILIWTKIIDAYFLSSVARWIMAIVPTHLLFIWLRSMKGCPQTQYSRHFFRFILAWFVLFSIAELLDCIFCILWVTPTWYEFLDYYYEIWNAVSAVEIIGSVLFSLLCAWFLFKLQNVVDPEIQRKRRQVFTIFLIYLSLTAYFSALASSDGVSGYIFFSAFAAYYVSTFVPRNAITKFDEAPSLPTAAPDQPTVIQDQPTVVMGQPLW